MTPKQILDSFSDTLMRDERILSAQERALVATLLSHANAAGGQSPETQNAVRAVIASALGETVAQRAFSVLGGSIVERILQQTGCSSDETARQQTSIDYVDEPQSREHAGGPPSPSPEPQPPGVRKPVREPQPPGTPVRTPKEPQPPGKPMGPPPSPSPEPQPPGVRLPSREPQPPGRNVHTTILSATSAAVGTRAEILPAQSCVLDEFLAPQELEELIRHTLEHESDFLASEVVSPDAEGGVVNYEHRRSRVLMDLGPYQQLILDRVRTVLPEVLHKLGMEEFTIADVEAQITASNNGDFFRFHCDNGSEKVASRYLTFVYFFHREPKRFEGGELRIHDARLEADRYVSEGSYQTIVPRQNQIVFFPCELMHEISLVRCPSGNFADGRFTLNGWLRH